MLIAGDEAQLFVHLQHLCSRDVFGFAETFARESIHFSAVTRAYLGQYFGEVMDIGFGKGTVHLATLARLDADVTDIDDMVETALAHTAKLAGDSF